MILFVGGKAQGKQAAVRAKYGAECDVWLYPEKLVRERLRSKRADQPQETLAILEEIMDMIRASEEPDRPLVVVSELVGCGVIPTDPMQEMYRETVGRLQVKLAERATEVWRVTCGITERLK